MGTFSKHSHRNDYFKGIKSFTATVDVSKTEVKENIDSNFEFFFVTLNSVNGQTS